jgi:hypothetical protein
MALKQKKIGGKVKKRGAVGSQVYQGGELPAYERVHINLRFADLEHLQLVRKAAAHSKLSMNAWLLRVTLEAARRELHLD